MKGYYSMLNFRSPDLKDKSYIEDLFKKSGYFGADNTFGSLYVWQYSSGAKICFYKNFLLRKYETNKAFYGFPIGEGNLIDAVEALIDNAAELGEKLSLLGLDKSMINKLEDMGLNDKFTYKKDLDISEYIYDSRDLIELNGKKYHSKRNHISKFKRKYEYEYEDISEKNINEVLDFLNRYCEENNCKGDKGLCNEFKALQISLANYFALGFIGGLIRVDGSIIAMTMGEEINSNIFVVHFEKALKSYDGSYTLINNEFAKRKLSTYKYINREEDLGIQGLRKAKKSYYPSIFLEKYNVTFN